MNETFTAAPPAAPIRKKRKKHLVRWIVVILVVLALGAGAWLLFGKKAAGAETVMTDTVTVGSITSTVTGSGLTKARNSETLMLTTTGTMTDVFITEGQHVEAGEKLFVIDSPAAETARTKAQSDLDGYRKQLATAEKDIAGLHLAAAYSGKLLETVDLRPGDEVAKGQRVATLADDTQMRLTQYYSYAYEKMLFPGQRVTVSIPALMASVDGVIDEVHLVSRITPEGSKLFSATILVPNDGALTVDMLAAATAQVDGETVYPYESGKLAYNRVGDLTSTVTGTVLSSRLCDYLPVKAGEVLVEIDGEASESELFTIRQNLQSAQEALDAAQKNLDNCTAVAPISGTVIGFGFRPGDEIPANTTLLTVSDASSILINATVDERNVSYLKPGMPVNLDQWGTPAFGTVETVSLSSTITGGVATYPVTISAENPDGAIQLNSYITYTLTASQSEGCLVLPVQCIRTAALEDGTIISVVYARGEGGEDEAPVIARDEEVPAGFYPVRVETGIQDTYNVEIRSGVSEGTEVFTQSFTDNAWG